MCVCVCLCVCVCVCVCEQAHDAYDYYDTGKGAGHAARHLYEAEGPAGRAAGR